MFANSTDSDFCFRLFNLLSSLSSFESHHEKTCFCIGKNKDADQLHGNHAADQRLWFRYIDSKITLLPESEISSL